MYSANLYEIKVEDRLFALNFNNTFTGILDHLVEVAIKKPEIFGTNDPNAIIDALFEHYPAGFASRESYKGFVRNMGYAYLFEIKSGCPMTDNVVKLELFRSLIENDKKSEFTGGILHVLKHFSLDGKYKLSTGNGEIALESLSDLFINIITGFYFNNRVKVEKKEGTFTSSYNYNGTTYKLVSFYEKNSQVNFITTLYKV